MSARPCPTCGTPVPTSARFCGHCGSTIDTQGPPPRAATQVGAPLKPGASLSQTMALDTAAAPGDEHDDVSAVPTPLVPPESLVAQEKSEELKKTLNDPEQQERARQMVQDAIAQRDKAAMHKTMMMGGTPSPLAETPPPPGADVIRQADASPLSRSVNAPSSWHPPPPSGNVQPAPIVPGAAPPPSFPPQPQPGLGLEARVPPGGQRTVQQVAHAPIVNAPAPEAPPPSPAALLAHSGKKTIVGMPASELAASGMGVPLPPMGAPATPAGNANPPPGASKTMLGVAVPGIAPTGAAGQEPPPPSQAAPMQLPSRQGTMLGVAAPGVAPAHASPRNQTLQQPHRPIMTTGLAMVPPVLPAPAPFVDEALPEAPRQPKKGGVSAVLVVGIVFVVVLVGGSVAAFFALRTAGSLTAQPQLDESGKESLRIGCTSCPDGTVVTLGASNATMNGNAATLPLPAPLSIGENDLTLHVDRPGSGRDEDVKVHVPVAYRVRADLTTLSAKPPVITVRIEALDGSDIKIEDKPITLSGGKANYVIDIASEIEGTSDEPKPIDKKISFSITPKGGKPEAGQLFARTTVVPLHLDAPGLALVTERPTVAVSGQTRAGGTVTIDGAAATVDPKGRFGVRVELGGNGERVLEIVASSPPLAPRIAKVKVTRTSSLEAAFKEQETGALAYAAFSADAAQKVGQKALVEGEVVDARASQGFTVLLVDEKKSCAKGQTCLVRVVHGEEDKVARGDSVRAVGRIVGVVSASGKTVPDVEAAIVIPKAAK